MIEGNQIPAEQDDIVVSVVGKRPEHQPYIWIGSDKGGMVASVHEKHLRKLRQAIDEALGDA